MTEGECPKCGDPAFWESGPYRKCETAACDVNAYTVDGRIVSIYVRARENYDGARDAELP